MICTVKHVFYGRKEFNIVDASIRDLSYQSYADLNEPVLYLCGFAFQLQWNFFYLSNE